MLTFGTPRWMERPFLGPFCLCGHSVLWLQTQWSQSSMRSLWDTGGMRLFHPSFLYLQRLSKWWNESIRTILSSLCCCLHLSSCFSLVLLCLVLLLFDHFSFSWGGVGTCSNCLFGVAMETYASACLFVWWACSPASCIMISSRPWHIESVCFLRLCNGYSPNTHTQTLWLTPLNVVPCCLTPGEL